MRCNIYLAESKVEDNRAQNLLTAPRNTVDPRGYYILAETAVLGGRTWNLPRGPGRVWY